MSEDTKLVELNPGDSINARTRRTKNWWEPMYSAECAENFKIADWDFKNNKGPSYLVYRSSELNGDLSDPIVLINFSECDFLGDFQHLLVFKDCTFTNCDFGLSTFIRAKFTRCTFKNTSFSQCKLQNCEFRDCKYIDISFSGNETQIPATLITEPKNFIFGGKAAVGKLPKNKSSIIQKLKFEETRSTLSRSILANLQSEGSETTYYSAVRTASICEDRARFARGAIKCLKIFYPDKDQKIVSRLWGAITGFVQCVSAAFSLLVLNVMGFLNGWGGNITRVLLLGAALVFALSRYMSYKYSVPYNQSLTETIEVFLLFGYTNHANNASQDFSQILTTALLGVFWYAIAIPTVVNRLTRSRG